MLRFVVSALLLVVSSSVPAVQSIEKWAKYVSPHFVVYSDRDAKRVEQDVQSLEQFRAMVFSFMRLPEGADMQPMTVYLFAKKRDLDTYTGVAKAGGMFISGMDGSFMLVGPGNNTQATRTLYHEYVHYLSNALNPLFVPTWYSEGVAEFLAAVRFKSDEAQLGGDLRLRQQSLKKHGLMSVERLLTQPIVFGESLPETYKFYASAWRFVQFLLLSGRNGFTDYSASLNAYLLNFNNGFSPQASFDAAFDVDMKTLNREFRAFHKKSRIKGASLKIEPVEVALKRKPLSESDVHVELSSLAFHRRQFELSNEHYQAALADRHPVALGFKADQLARKAHFDEALALAGELTTLDSQDPTLLHAIASVHLMAAQHFDDAQKVKRHETAGLAAADRAFEAGWLPQTSRMLAMYHWSIGNKQLAVDHAVSWVNHMPSNLHANLLAGEYMQHSGNEEYARFFLGNVVAWAHGSPLARRAQSLLDEMRSASTETNNPEVPTIDDQFSISPSINLTVLPAR